MIFFFNFEMWFLWCLVYSLEIFVISCDQEIIGGIRCYYCEGRPDVCNQTDTFKKCAESENICYFQIYQTKRSISADDFEIETKYVKDCGSIYEDYCGIIETFKSGIQSCQIQRCNEDLCNMSFENMKQNQKEFFVSNGMIVFAKRLTIYLPLFALLWFSMR